MLVFKPQCIVKFWLSSSKLSVLRIILKKKFLRKIYGFCQKNENLSKKH